MLFKKEDEMYPIIRSYFQDQGFKVVVDSPRGSGIFFRSLKGWNIDIAGMKKAPVLEVVAVEVKKDLGKSSILDALSKAEMYRGVCNRTYIAFPNDVFNEADNKEAAKEIDELCKRRGIGLFIVGKKCEEIINASTASLRIELFNDIVNQISAHTIAFEGFEKEDFLHYYDAYRRKYVWKKFQLLKHAFETEITKWGLVCTREARQDSWWFSFSRQLPRKRARYFGVAHFTLSFRPDDGIVVELIVRSRSRDFRKVKKRIKSNPSSFIKIIRRLEKSPYEFQISASERYHVAPYQTRASASYTLDSPYMQKDQIEQLSNLLVSSKRSVWLLIECMFHLNSEEIASPELAHHLVLAASKLKPIYNYAVK